MPQATDALRNRMKERFGNAIGCAEPWRYLKDRGYTAPSFLIRAPRDHKVTADEGECIDFLCDEWDWAFAPDTEETQR